MKNATTNLAILEVGSLQEYDGDRLGHDSENGSSSEENSLHLEGIGSFDGESTIVSEHEHGPLLLVVGDPVGVVQTLKVENNDGNLLSPQYLTGEIARGDDMIRRSSAVRAMCKVWRRR